MTKLNIENKLKSILKPSAMINFTRAVYSFGIFFICLYLIYEKILANYFEGIVETRINNYAIAYDKLLNPLVVFQSWQIIVVPALLLLLFFLILFFVIRCHDKRRYLSTAVIKSYIIIVIFSYITLKFSFLVGSLQSEIQSFNDIAFAQVFGFMFIYSIPITLSMIINHNKRGHYFRDFIVFFVLIFLANVPNIIQDNFSFRSVFFAIHGLGIFYFLGMLLSLLSCLDYFAAEIDSGPGSFLIYLGLPAYIVIVISAFIFIIIYLLIGVLFNSTLVGMEIFVPFEQVYYYIKNILNYTDLTGFISSLGSAAAVIQISLSLYKKGSWNGDLGWDFSQIFRSFAGIGFISYFFSLGLPCPWYIATPVIFCLLVTCFFLIKRKLLI